MITAMARVNLAEIEPGVRLQLTVSNDNADNMVSASERIISIWPMPQGDDQDESPYVTVSADGRKFFSSELLVRGRLKLPRVLRAGQDLSEVGQEQDGFSGRHWAGIMWSGSSIREIKMWDEPTQHEIDLAELPAGSIVSLRSASMEAAVFITGRATPEEVYGINGDDQQGLLGNVVTTSLDPWKSGLAEGGHCSRFARLGSDFSFGNQGVMSSVIWMQVH